MRIIIHASGSHHTPAFPAFVGGEETVQVSEALHGMGPDRIDVLYVPQTVTVAQKKAGQRVAVLDRFAGGLAKLVTGENVGAKEVRTWMHRWVAGMCLHAARKPTERCAPVFSAPQCAWPQALAGGISSKHWQQAPGCLAAQGGRWHGHH